MQQWSSSVASSPELESNQLLQPPMDFMRNMSLMTVLCYVTPCGLVDRCVGLLNAISYCII
jgi:hypothetical protein